MKALIVSDSHGRTTNLEKVIEKTGAIDVFIHLGDFEGQEEYIKGLVDCETYFVSGNNDFLSNEVRDREVTLGKYRVLLTHGHRYHVHYGTEELLDAAICNAYDIVMYGHTHTPKVMYEQGIYIVNPGSITLPRQDGHRPSYMIMETDRNGEVYFAINYL